MDNKLLQPLFVVILAGLLLALVIAFGYPRFWITQSESDYMEKSGATYLPLLPVEPEDSPRIVPQ